MRLRWSEWLSLLFFAYLAGLIPFLHDRPFLGIQPLGVLVLVFCTYAGLAAGERRGPARAFSIARDWIPIGITLLAFQEMDLFRPMRFSHRYEGGWMLWDVRLFGNWGLTRAIEGIGWVVPWILEASYLLVYGVAAIAAWMLYLTGRRSAVDRFFFLYFAGTLGAYALFPFFPSEPPRYLYPDLLMPGVTTWMRSLNLFLLRNATIHMSVFPSAHVSSAFSTAWAMFLLLPRHRRLGWFFLLYAVVVAVATVYGRYHYAADAVAGIAVSLAAAAAYVVFAKAIRRTRTAD